MAARSIAVLGLWGLLLAACDDGSEAEGDADASDTDDEASSGMDAETTGDNAEGGQCPDVVLDGSFEEGPNTVGWSTGSTNWQTPICNATCYVGENRAFDGDWWVWFGGMPVPESAYVSQMVPLARGEAELLFRVLIISETPSLGDNFTVLVDGSNVFQISGEDETMYEDYVDVRVDLTEFADGSIHELSFDANFDGMSTTSFFLDAVELRSCG